MRGERKRLVEMTKNAKSRHHGSFQMLKIGETRLERNCWKDFERKESKGTANSNPHTKTVDDELNVKEVCWITYKCSVCRPFAFEDQAYRFEEKKSNGIMYGRGKKRNQ